MTRAGAASSGTAAGTTGGGIGAASGASVALVAVSDDVSWDFVSDFAFFDDDTFGDSGCSDVVAGTLPLAGAKLSDGGAGTAVGGAAVLEGAPASAAIDGAA